MGSQSNLPFPPDNKRQGMSKTWIDFEGKKGNGGSASGVSASGVSASGVSASGVSDGSVESERAIKEKYVNGGEIRKMVRVIIEERRKDSAGGAFVAPFISVLASYSTSTSKAVSFDFRALTPFTG